MSANDLSVIFVDPPQYPGYRVGRNGSIWSRWVKGLKPPTLGTTWRKLKPSTMLHGHLVVTLTKNARKTMVHRVVLLAFVGPCPDGMEGCHNDGNPANNAISNLRYDTHASNMADRRKHGTGQDGERNPQAILTAQFVQVARSEFSQKLANIKQLARRYGVAPATMSDVVNRRSWKHI